MNRMRLASFILTGIASMSAGATPNITVSYIDPHGVALEGSPIEMWVSVKADRQVGTALGAPFGFDPSDLPKAARVQNGSYAGLVPFASYTSISISAGYGCSVLCAPAGYVFAYPSSYGAKSFWSLSGENLATGDYLVGSFIPDGHATSGLLNFSLTPTLWFNVQGLSATGAELSEYLGPVNGFNACLYEQRASCGFTRTISSVPEPSSQALVMLGFSMLCASAWRRKSKHQNDGLA